MKNDNILSLNLPFTYFVIYYSDDELEDIKPIKYGTREDILQQQVTYHLLPREQFSLVDIFSKVMQLPRSFFDLYRIPFQVLTEISNYSHSIIHLPQYFVDVIISQGSEKLIRFLNPTLLIYDERCGDEAERFEKALTTSLGKMTFEEFSDSKPKDFWRKLQDLHYNKKTEKLQIPNLEEFLSTDELNVLPSFLYLIQNDDFDRYLKRDKSVESAFHFTNRILDEYNVRIKAMKTVIESKSDDKEKNSKHYYEQVAYLSRVNHKSMIITLPGIPNLQKSDLRDKDVNENYVLERHAIKNVGIYRAMTSNSAYLELDYMGQELYNIVYQLEKHCMGKINNKFIWKSLKRFGDIISKNLSDEELELIAHSKKITYYSDLPLGIAILPNTTSPLNCYTSLSANNLTPLSRLYQTEFPGQEDVLISGTIKVLFAECLNKKDRIREFSESSWDGIENNLKNHETIEIVREETNTVYKLKKFLRSNTDANVLIISAHGHYDLERKLSGIVVGDEFWNANENDFRVPKIVILSSCHVSPRGVGAINVSDLFFRNGAVSVIGTLIPIHVVKNSLFMQRLLIYMIESLDLEDSKSLDDIWSHVVATNAVLEIIHSSQNLKEWAFTKNRKSVAPIQEFMLGKSKIDLRTKHIYKDSVKRLIEIAKEDGMDKYLQSVIDSQGVFPESIFYVLYGNPELIHFGIARTKQKIN